MAIESVFCPHCGKSLGDGVDQFESIEGGIVRPRGLLLLDHRIGTRRAILPDEAAAGLPEICKGCGANDRNADRRSKATTAPTTAAEEPTGSLP